MYANRAENGCEPNYDLLKQNQLLHEENQANLNCAIELAKQNWLNNDTHVALLQALQQVPSSVDQVHQQNQRLLLCQRLIHCQSNLSKLVDLLPIYMQNYQQQLEQERKSRYWLSYYWYMRSYHYYTGIEKMQQDSQQKWLSILKGQAGKINQLLQQEIMSWVVHPRLPLSVDEIFKQGIDLLLTSVKAILQTYPSGHLCKVSYESYLIAYANTLVHIQQQNIYCDKEITARDFAYWWGRFYVQAKDIKANFEYNPAFKVQ